MHDKRVLGRVLSKNHLPLAAIGEKMHVKNIGFSNRIAAKKSFLSQEHNARRLAFAKKHRALDNIWLEECDMDG